MLGGPLENDKTVILIFKIIIMRKIRKNKC